MTEEIAQIGEKESRTAEICPGLDDQIGTLLGDDLLIDPTVQGRLLYGNTEPVGVI